MDTNADRKDELQTHSNLRNLFETIPEMMGMLCGKNHTFEYANKSYQYFFGDTPVGTKASQVFSDCVDVLGILHSVYRTGVSASLKEHPIPTFHGLRYFDFTFSARRDQSSSIDGVVFLGTDITQRVLSRKKLEASETRLRQAARAGKLGFWEYDIQNDVLTWSPEVMEQWGVFKDRGTKMDVYNRLSPEDGVILKQLWDTTIASGIPYHTEHRITRDDGSVVWVESQGDCVYKGTLPVRVTGTSLDITERKKIEFELKLAKEAAESANHAKSKFLANISHEIRNPLGAISGFVKLLKNPELSKITRKKYVSIVERNAEQLLKLVDDILDLSKVEAGRMLVETIEIDLPEFLSELTSLMKLRARDKNINFETIIKGALPEKIESDPTRIRQILNNIIGNALKFTDQGSIRIEVELNENRLSFNVIDTGLGISNEQRNKLFNAFTQAEASTARKYGGTGLGLILTQKLCEALGGEYKLLHSAPGQGSHFLATIQVGIKPETRLLGASEFPLGVSESIILTQVDPKLIDMHILVVEDSADNRDLIEIMLTEAGARVELANDGNEGVKKAIVHPYHVILMDIQMPNLDGHGAARELRHRGYTGPIVALTAHAMKEEQNRCIESGFTHVLTKPIHQESMILALESYKPIPVESHLSSEQAIASIAQTTANLSPPVVNPPDLFH